MIAPEVSIVDKSLLLRRLEKVYVVILGKEDLQGAKVPSFVLVKELRLLHDAQYFLKYFRMIPALNPAVLEEPLNCLRIHLPKKIPN